MNGELKVYNDMQWHEYCENNGAWIDKKNMVRFNSLWPENGVKKLI